MAELVADVVADFVDGDDADDDMDVDGNEIEQPHTTGRQTSAIAAGARKMLRATGGRSI